MSEWGLTSERNSKGERKPVEYEYEYQGEEVRVKLLPPTVSELEEYEELGEDTGAGELAEIVDKHIVKPEVDDPTIRELFCYVEGIVSYGASGGNDFVAEARKELEERADESGN